MALTGQEVVAQELINKKTLVQEDILNFTITRSR